ncbi:MAG: hypothetical protein JWO72_1552 [Caulobacteraceae bacterium]|nr:hypothetical protein [Caulobacteraceae bacterium]
MNAPVRDKTSPGDRKAAKRAFDKGGLFRLSRMLHAYLSAFAFLALIFFSATGILLNHPEWFDRYQPAERSATVTLSPAELAAAKASPDQARALAQIIARKTPLIGAYASGDLQGREALLRLEGPKGSSDIDVDLASGRSDVKTAQANLTAFIQDLHRGKNSGSAWRFVIDSAGYVVLALSLSGYVLFFSLRFRLKTSLVLTGVSLLALAAVALWLVP